MADKKFGLKRVCSNCELKFYDLNKKSPLICPQCKTEIVIEDEFSFVNNDQMGQVEKKIEVKDELSDLENTEEQSDEDDVISLDDAAIEEENQKN